MRRPEVLPVNQRVAGISCNAHVDHLVVVRVNVAAVRARTNTDRVRPTERWLGRYDWV